MEMGRRWCLAIAGASILAWSGFAQGTTKVILDNFNVNEGHFNQAPGFSGSNRNLDGAASTAERVTTDGPLEGAGQEKLVLKTAASWATPPGPGVFYCRFLSGGGSAASNTAFTTSAATDGWLGFYAKTTQANMSVQIWIEGGSPAVNNNSNPKALINDGQWHLYEWNLDDDTGGPDGWVTSPGILTGDPVIHDSSHTIDSIIIRGTQDFTNGQVLDPIYLDFVAVNPNGSLADLLTQPCLLTADVGGVSGPAQAGDTSVVVTGASTTLKSANGDAIYVYADGVKIGELTTGFNTTTGTNTIPLFATPSQVALVKGQHLTATQRISGQEGCQPDPSTGVVVGGGNSSVRLTLSVRDLAGLNGPLGADGGTGGKLVWVGLVPSPEDPAVPTPSIGGSPQGALFTPSNCWQTVEFRPATDLRLNFAGTGDGTAILDLTNRPWGEIEHLAVAMDATAPNTGPYTIYVDDVENGATGFLTGFESGESQTVDLDQVNVLFSVPSFSGTTSGSLLTVPDVSKVTNEQAYNGERSLKLQWQFRSENTSSWVRITAATNNGHAYQNPMIRLDQPVRMRILMVPAGQTVGTLPHITAQPTTVSDKCVGETASFSVTATGTNALSYQWLKSPDGNAAYAPIDGATNTTYSFTVTNDDASNGYRVEVKDTVSNCTTQSNPVRVALTPIITQQPSPLFVCMGQSATFTVAASAPHTAYQWREDGNPLSNGNGISGVNTATLKIDPVTGARHGRVYTVEVGNGCTPALTALSAGAVLTVSNYPSTIVRSPASGLPLYGSPASVSVGGFTAQYFNVTAQAAPVLQPNAIPSLIRLDPLINFDWLLESPGPNVGIDGFIVRWQAKLIVPFTEDYTFYTRTDDGARLWVNGTLVIDHWVDQGPTEWCGPGATAPGTCTVVPLTAGQVADIRMEYYENGGGAVASLSWSSTSVPKQPVSPLGVQWLRNGQLISNTTTLISTASASGAIAGTYTAQYVDPCTGQTVNTPPVTLELFADYSGDGLVNETDISLFIDCATGPDVPFAPVDPCKAFMDGDGDGDVDQADFGVLQSEIGVTP